MYTIDDQLALEREMYEEGVTRYHANLQAAKTRINKVGKRVDAANEANTTYGRMLLKEFINDVQIAISEAINDMTKPASRKTHIALKYMNQIDPSILAFITTRTILDTITRKRKVQHLANLIGNNIEDQVRLTRFQEENAGYFNAIAKDQKARLIKDYRRKRKEYVRYSKKYGATEWQNWANTDKVHLGSKLIECFIHATGLVEKVYVNQTKNGRMHKVIEIRPTEECVQWIKDNISLMEALSPRFLPCVIPPCEWVSPTEGGFYSKEVRRTLSFVNVKHNKAHLALLAKKQYRERMQPAYDATNALQRVAWQVNTRVLDKIMADFQANTGVGLPETEPVYVPKFDPNNELPKVYTNEDGSTETVTREDSRYKKAKLLRDEDKEAFKQYKKECITLYESETGRRSKALAVGRTLSVAKRMSKYKHFYFVYNRDFRGRSYCVSPDLSPQGDDLNKALLMFANGVPLGDDGLVYMMIEIANVFGNDKVSYQDRVTWTQENTQAIVAMVEDGDTDLFKQADKPWQFYAVCCEYVEAIALDNPSDYVSYLGWAQDGSCNGLQHFSMMLRDSVGGAAVNLLPSAKPEDIYDVVAQRVETVIRATLRDDTASSWDKFYAEKALELGINRKLTKRSVMVLPYGGTTSSCREYVTEYYHKHAEQQRKLDPKYKLPFGKQVKVDGVTHGGLRGYINWLSPIVWKAISETVIAARSAMTYLQQAARILAKGNNYVTWQVPKTGFLVYQYTEDIKINSVCTHLLGECRLSVASGNGQVSVPKMASSIAPNFVHSLDAAHLDCTILAANENEIKNLWVVHDSYKAPFGQSGKLSNIIRQQFYALYTDHDVLREWADYQLERNEELHKLEFPVRGDLRAEQVLKSKYFFG